MSGEYGDYLALPEILSAQRPRSEEHDELLFIVIHQATELWMKLVIHELSFAQRELHAHDLGPALKALARVARTQHVLIESWSVLSTLTPSDYLEFRHLLGTASGFQSVQYRSIEFILGRRDERYLKTHNDTHRAELEALLDRPSLYDETLLLLAAHGFAIDSSVIERPWRRQHESHQSVLDAWLEIYRNSQQHWALYELAEKLVDLEHAFSHWRFEHYKTVHRIIGNKRGTGGTSGLGYLKQALDFTFFPELWEVRTLL